MSRPFVRSILSANDLLTGRVVYLTNTDGWTNDIRRAVVFDDKAEAIARLAWAEAQTHQVIAPVLAPVRGAAPFPTSNRDRLRATGPFSLAGKPAQETPSARPSETPHV